MERKNWTVLPSILMMMCLLASFTGKSQIFGNGKIVSEERVVTGFKSISVRNAITLYLRQGTEEKVKVEADENILPYLITEVSSGELKISIKGNINNTNAMNVFVTVKNLEEVEAGSAARVKTEEKIETGHLKISAGSAASFKMEIKCDQLTIRSASGSSLAFSGSARSIETDSSSGSFLNTSDLQAENGEVEASSGASVKVRTDKEIRARASSGAHITVSGNPVTRNTDCSSGGSVSFR